MNLSLSLCFKAVTFLSLCAVVIGCLDEELTSRHQWSPAELKQLQSLHLASLPKVTDPGNMYVDNDAAAELGKKLFFSPLLSQNGDTSCAHCHQPKHYFTSGKPVDGKRNTPTVVGAAAFTWQFWDGRADSLWSQALFPLEDPTEHALTRLEAVNIVLNHFLEDFISVFGETSALTWFLQQRIERPEQGSTIQTPSADSHGDWEALSEEQRTKVNQLFTSIGKALAAYQARLMPEISRFDRYVDAVVEEDFESASQYLSAAEEAGLRIFISERGGCVRCHNGPMFSNGDFTATAVPKSIDDEGRLAAIAQITSGEFNCLSQYADRQGRNCDELTYLKTKGEELRHAFKVPSLRNITLTAPYMHNGSFTHLSEVLDYYNRSPRNGLNHTELEPLYLFPFQLEQLEQFLSSLESGIAPSSVWGLAHNKEKIE
ncbi:cytochrome-c peroxidase [Photobacterium satsumensis]|uniref:cytochrome-c peroxidase n=1 Tax=Photobacterium satsumensis TaxID=2910239 RepID=UPI003D0AFB9E